ncbi:MAG: rRNA maturation RNase YbeY [Gammaproteobacteria bacterium]|jgi:probable rRNA maturation factor|nr:rRNA maturation RNase YbeY [Gammaproteobacteria bacterium]
MSIEIETDVQWAVVDEVPIPADAFVSWVTAAMVAGASSSSRDKMLGARKKTVTVRVVDDAESAELNQRYRSKAGSTNVLAFPSDSALPHRDILDEQELGDLVICLPVVIHEASGQSKTLLAHMAHMVVHGTLHLLGFDHIKHSDAEVMEGLEVTALGALGYSNPYQVAKD